MGFVDEHALWAGLDDVRRSPAQDGRVELIVRRPAENERELLDEAQLDSIEGLVGDTWKARGSSRTPDGAAHPDMQVTMMNVRLAGLVAGLIDGLADGLVAGSGGAGFGGPADRRALAGDQLYVDLDLSEGNLPAGCRLALGSAVIEVSGQPHLGCGKFRERFGEAALSFVNSPKGRELRLRGLNARVVAGGTVRVGDVVHKLAGGAGH